MMLQIKIGHISSPPFWRYSITIFSLTFFRLTGKPTYGRFAIGTVVCPKSLPAPS